MALLLALAHVASASGTIASGAYSVYYSAVNSMQIPASVARANAITRNGDRIVVMITLQKPTKESPLQAVPATVSGSARTLMGNKHALSFRRVTDAGSVYSLAELDLDEDEQTLTFDLDVQSVDGKATVPVTFSQTVYTE